jgi:hypothetical protein
MSSFGRGILYERSRGGIQESAIEERDVSLGREITEKIEKEKVRSGEGQGSSTIDFQG